MVNARDMVLSISSGGRPGLQTERMPMPRILQICLLPSCLLMAGCDPLINIEGAYFPSWLVSGLTGVAGTVVLHVVLLKMGIDDHLWPRPLVYFASFVMLTFTTWLVLYAN